MKTKRIPSEATRCLFAAIAVVSSLVLLPWLNKSIWADEGASLYSSHLSWSELWRQSQATNRVQLAYYALLHLWLDFSASIEWARLLSLLAFGLTVFLVGRLGSRLGGLRCGVVAALLAATNPLLVEAALDARPYALASLMAAASIVALFRWLEVGEVRWMWLFLAGAIITVALQLFFVLAPLSVIAVAFVVRPEVFRRRWRALLAPLVLTLFASLSMVTLVEGQRGQIAWIPSITVHRLVQDLPGPASGGQAAIKTAAIPCSYC